MKPPSLNIFNGEKRGTWWLSGFLKKQNTINWGLAWRTYMTSIPHVESAGYPTSHPSQTTYMLHVSKCGAASLVFGAYLRRSKRSSLRNLPGLGGLDFVHAHGELHIRQGRLAVRVDHFALRLAKVCAMWRASGTNIIQCPREANRTAWTEPTWTYTYNRVSILVPPIYRFIYMYM